MTDPDGHEQGSAPARHALVEASWSAVRTPGLLPAFYRRIHSRRGHHVAIVAASYKLACLFWVLPGADRTTPAGSRR